LPTIHWAANRQQREPCVGVVPRVPERSEFFPTTALWTDACNGVLPWRAKGQFLVPRRQFEGDRS